ncbi:hypothetical protein HDE_11138 [Halotydeus destructor]|nr:hypothetical protein HDE_11138 [Halotydeus destructor]
MFCDFTFVSKVSTSVMVLIVNIAQIVGLVGLISPIWAVTDLTLVAGSSGRDVVEATLAKIQRANIFSDDKRYLRRLAFVETQDGDSPSTYSGHNGGIWCIDEDRLLTTRDTSRSTMMGYHEKILSSFGIDWSTVKMADLDTPLISALAARLRLAEIQANIPSELNGQAQYWKEHNGRGPVDRFLAAIDQLERSEPSCERKWTSLWSWTVHTALVKVTSRSPLSS